MSGSGPGGAGARGAREKVLLLHGLWMRGAVMAPLAARLRAAGFDTEVVDYFSVAQGPEPCIARIAARLAQADGTLHLVGHSLGGVIAVRAALAVAAGAPGRIVCLGSPLAGSAAARRLGGGPTATLLGRASGLLAQGIERLPAREVGLIAGDRPLGLGRFFGRFDGPSDGTVAVAETRVPGLADHVVIRSSHSGMVFAPRTAELVTRFLRDGRFSAAR